MNWDLRDDIPGRRTLQDPEILSGAGRGPALTYGFERRHATLNWSEGYQPVMRVR